jgi:hypothetical protein
MKFENSRCPSRPAGSVLVACLLASLWPAVALAQPTPSAPIAQEPKTSGAQDKDEEEEEESAFPSTGPLSGYMDLHFNKPRGEAGVLDFHRFVLLFNHAFSPRLRFVGELELEHAFVEGLEEAGELELEQAYLDFLVTRSFNVRAGMVLTTPRHANPLFDRRPVELFADLLLHDIGTGDGIAQGAAEPQEIRTPALWGLGLRKPFLHDGRASTIEEAVEHHGGEAALARQGYMRLDTSERARLIAFLRSL